MEDGDSEPRPDDRGALSSALDAAVDAAMEYGELPSRSAMAASRIRLRHLTCFVVVAQERTLAAAAARLHLSQPAVSKTLAELEELAGRRLVERGRAGTQLTSAGEEFLRYAVDVT